VAPVLRLASHAHIHMVENRNQEIVKQIAQAGGLEMSDGMPSAITNSYVPVIEVNPRVVKMQDKTFNNDITASGGGTIMSNQGAGVNFILKNITLAIIKDATCDTADGVVGINGTVGGVSIRLITLPCLTLTAQEQSLTLNFGAGLKLDAGSTITFTSNTFTAGKFSRSGLVSGYIESPRMGG